MPSTSISAAMEACRAHFEAEKFITRISERAIAMEGTCTGEHGIGQGKIPYLRQELGGAVDVMQSIKQALDPLNIMNPGKIFGVTAP